MESPKKMKIGLIGIIDFKYAAHDRRGFTYRFREDQYFSLLNAKTKQTSVLKWKTEFCGIQLFTCFKNSNLIF